MGVEDGSGDGFAGVDEAGGGVGFQPECFAGQVGQDAVGRYVCCQVLVEGGLLGGGGDGLVRPAAPGGCGGAPLGVGLGDREEGSGVEAEVAEQFRRQPEVLAGVGGQAFQQDGFFGDATARSAGPWQPGQPTDSSYYPQDGN